MTSLNLDLKQNLHGDIDKAIDKLNQFNKMLDIVQNLFDNEDRYGSYVMYGKLVPAVSLQRGSTETNKHNSSS